MLTADLYVIDIFLLPNLLSPMLVYVQNVRYQLHSSNLPQQCISRIQALWYFIRRHSRLGRFRNYSQFSGVRSGQCVDRRA